MDGGRSASKQMGVGYSFRKDFYSAIHKIYAGLDPGTLIDHKRHKTAQIMIKGYLR